METGIGIIGFGFMGKTHLRAWLDAISEGAPAKVVAIYCPEDLTPSAAGNVDTGAEDEVDPVALGIKHYRELDQFLEDPHVSAVSLCTPTDTHVEIARQSLVAGKDVLIEKPVALEAESIEELIGVVNDTGCKCMPAMCMRYWPGWSWLRDQVKTGQLGPVVTARFSRIGAIPGWSQDFYHDEKRSGGALTDLHIHDVDFILSTFGKPASVFTTGQRNQMLSSFLYPDGPQSVTAEGAWYPAASYPFQMRYRVSFRDCVADYDLAREGRELLLYKGEEVEEISLPSTSGYQQEIEHFLRWVRGESSSPPPTLSEAKEVARWIAAESESLEKGSEVSMG
ncbi:MAG: hypothetical protein CBC13_06875 [Planctomycetia bacterium TMED53]|nr:MAG: hypothetical protein CBC13_06875 [Planctomycetia bacterium TMED53]